MGTLNLRWRVQLFTRKVNSHNKWYTRRPLKACLLKTARAGREKQPDLPLCIHHLDACFPQVTSACRWNQPDTCYVPTGHQRHLLPRSSQYGPENHVNTPLMPAAIGGKGYHVTMQPEWRNRPADAQAWPSRKPQCSYAGLRMLAPYPTASLGAWLQRNSGAWPIGLHCRGAANEGSA